MVTRPAGNEHQASAAAHDGEVSPQAAEGDFVGVEVDSPTHGVDDGLGLLVDLLLHEVVEFALHDRSDLDLERLDAASCRDLARCLGLIILAAQTVDMQLAARDVRDIVILEVENTLGVLDDCCCVRSDEELDGLRKTILRHESTGLCLGARDHLTRGWSKQTTLEGGGD